MLRTIIFILFFVFNAIFCIKPYFAVVQVPVANVVSTPLKKNESFTNLKEAYDKMPFVSYNGIENLCPRVHQLLMHEEVNVIDEKGHEICITIPDIFCIDHQNKKQQYFWTLKEYVVKKNLINHPEKLPLPFKKALYTKTPHTTITLIQPWYDQKTKHAFSVGTRFVVAQKNSINNTHPYIYVFVLHDKAMMTVCIPRSHCIIHLPYEQKTFDQKKELFLHILYTWARNTSAELIPYVWGGCSFTQRTPYSMINQIHTVITQPNTSRVSTFPFATGLDCSGLILRAAQIAQLPYTLKNSTTIKASLEPLRAQSIIKNGDIIWFQGHVMVVSDVEKNLIIESRHYKSGYGYVHEAPVVALFKGIKTVQELLKAITAKRTITLLHKDGSLAKKITDAKIFSLDSLKNKRCE